MRPTLPPASPGTLGTGTAVAPQPAGVPAAPPAAAGAPALPVPLRHGARLALYDHHMQGRAAAAQQALQFLGQLGGQLEALKSTLSQTLTGRQDLAGRLEGQLEQLAKTMERRRLDSGASVDANLHFSGPSQSTQQFRVRGMNLGVLESGSGQVLSFTVGAGQPLAVAIEAGMDGKQIVRQIDHALAPAGVRVSADAGGALVFSTPENAWPTVRDTLAIAGVGRLAVEEDAGLVRPQEWAAKEPAAMRQSLQQVVQAIGQGRNAEQAAGSVLEAAARQADAPGAAVADMQQVAQAFASTASAATYPALLALRSALDGISRERVTALLRPR